MRVLVMRPAAAAARSADVLRRRGHEPLVAPILTVEATGAARPSGPFAALLVTSGHAIPALAAGGAALGHLPVFTVGDRTADALAAAGFRRARSAPDGAALARLVSAELKPCRLLHVAGRDRKAEPAATLAAAGFETVVWETYRAQRVGRLPPAAAEALAAGRLDAALHYSRASAAAALGLVRAAGREEAFACLLHLCLSGDVAAGLDGLPPARLRIAAAPDEARLLDLLPPVPIRARQARAGDGPGAKDGTIAPA